MKKYHISIFTTNILAIVLAVFFARGYNAKGIPLTSISIIMAVILAVFLILTIFILKPGGKIEKVFPSKNLLLLNSGISLVIGLFFLNEIGLMGFFFTLLFSFLLSEIEHIIYEGAGA